MARPLSIHFIHYVHLGLSDAARHVERDLVFAFLQPFSSRTPAQQVCARLRLVVYGGSDALPIWLCSGFCPVGVQHLVNNLSRTFGLLSFIPSCLHQHRRVWIYSLCALMPAFVHLGLRALYTASSGQVGQGSSLLVRIGVSGDDLHNGGIVGALQFLGGVRVSQCISMLGADSLYGASLMSKISAFNCSLSVLGMFLLSALSVLGVIWLLRTKPASRTLLFPVAMILLITVSVLQQSFSVHLLGHSYPFALLFACGLVGLCLKGAEVIQSRSLSLIVFTPIVVACVLLSIRVSMLSEVPG